MAEKTEYAELTVDELKAELEKRDLPKSGKKAELITRLEDDDTAQGGTAPENEVEAEPAEAAAEAERNALANQPAFQKLMRRLGYEKRRR